MRIGARILLAINALGFLATSLLAIFNLNDMTSSVGIRLQSAVGANEFLANYAGMYAALGLYFGVIAISRRVPPPEGPSSIRDLAQAILILTLCCGGLIAGRLYSALAYGLPSSMQIGFAFWELTSFLIGLFLLIATQRP